MKGGKKTRKERKGNERNEETKGGNSKKDSYTLVSDSLSWSPEDTFQNQAGDQSLIK